MFSQYHKRPFSATLFNVGYCIALFIYVFRVSPLLLFLVVFCGDPTRCTRLVGTVFFRLFFLILSWPDLPYSVSGVVDCVPSH